MQTYSRDGKFLISTLYDTVNNIHLKATQDVSLIDVANAIFQDCFENDTLGLNLQAEIIYYKVSVDKKRYFFEVEKPDSIDTVLETLAEQLPL